jgi:hypothetical protein
MHIFKVTALLLSIVIIGTFLLLERYKPASKTSLSERPRIRNMQPIGEITNGFRVEQLISISSIFDQTNLFDKYEVCIELFLANFSNRKNTGEFAVDLVLNKEVFTSVLDASTIADNQYQKICYDKLSSSMLISQKDIRLILRGISSPPGEAITAWTTTDLRAGQLINVPASLELRSLVFHFVTKQESKIIYRHALIILILNMLAIATLIIPAKVSRKHNVLIAKDNLK